MFQMRAENQPVPNESGKTEEAASSDHNNPQHRGRVGSTSSILRKLMEKVVKPKQPQTIHSGTISEEERHSTLAPFIMSGIPIGQVNRDYEAFFKTAWGNAPSSASKSSAAIPSGPSPLVQLHSPHNQAEREDPPKEPPKRERRTEQPLKNPRPANIGAGRSRAFTYDDDKPGISRSPPRSPQLRRAKKLNAPDVSLHVRYSGQRLTILTLFLLKVPRPLRLPSPPPARRPPLHQPLAKKPSAPSIAMGGGGAPPLPAPRPHSKLIATNSEGKSKRKQNSHFSIVFTP